MSNGTPDRLNVLFIGNSFTARNDMPGLIARLAGAEGGRLEHELISAGGASLRMHWNKGEAASAIRAGGWDYVVLQEQSTLPIKNAARFHENVRLFSAPIHAAGARMALYLTWARRNAPAAQRQLTEAYAAIAAELDSTLVPVGIAWERFLGTHAEPVLHDRDASHPTLAGSFLAACVFYATLFKKSPAKLEVQIPGLSGAHAKLLKQVAREAVTGEA